MAKDVAISKQNSPKTNKTKKQNKTQQAFFFKKKTNKQGT